MGMEMQHWLEIRTQIFRKADISYSLIRTRTCE